MIHICSGGCFNEAGAINPGKLLLDESVFGSLSCASMRPGQLTPENRSDRDLAVHGIRASMRPGQLTPENPHVRKESLK